MNMRRIFLYCMTGAALALAGCGGNGGGTPMMEMRPQTPSSVSLAGLLPGYTNLGRAGTFNINAGAPPVNREDGTFTCTGTGMAVCRVTVTANGMVTFVRGTLENGQFKEDDSSNAALTVTASQSAMTRKAAADKAAADRAAANMAATAAEDRAYGLALTGAQRTDMVMATNETWNASAPSNPMPGISVGRTNNNFGDTLNVQPEAHLTAANTPEFMKQGADTMLGTFKGEVHTKTVTKGDVSTKTDLMIYHDKAATGPIPYNVYYAMGSTATSRVNGRPGANNGSGTFVTTAGATQNTRLAVTAVNYGTANTEAARLNGVLTLKVNTATTELTAAETALFSSSELPSAPSQTFRFDGSTNAKARTFDGTFNGIAGKFTCIGSTCSATRLPNGNLRLQASGGGNVKGPLDPGTGTTTGPGWYFVPTATASSIMLPNLDYDTDYLTFGYWLAEETETGEPTTYQIRTFGTGSMVFGSNTGTAAAARNQDIESLTGTATYAGAATGHYQHHVIQADGTPTPGRSSQGQFTATARLTAQFGVPSSATGSVAVNDLFSIRGDLTNFKAIGHSNANLLDGWDVSLERAKFGYRPGGIGGTYATTGSGAAQGAESNSFPFGPNANRGGRTTATLGKTATSPGTAGGTKGNWRGTFFGPTGTPAATTYPTGVAGTFDANFSNGKAVGAYGATRQQQ